MTQEQMLQHLGSANEVAKQAVKDGYHPFEAALVAPDNRTVFRTQPNVDVIRHAETELARRAAGEYERSFLWNCTLATSIDPCAMCAGTQYWANIGQLVFGVKETELENLTGNNAENPTMELSCRTVFESSQKQIQVHGPFPEIAEAVLELHRTFWKS